MGLKEFEEFWISQTDEEEVYFELFEEPRGLRRPTTGIAALASLVFGQYKNLKGEWVDNDRVIWLGFIMSEEPGAGSKLLDQIKQGARKNGLAICGEPVALKPKDWSADRPWMRDVKQLICWYVRHGFLVVQTKWNARVWYVPPGLELALDEALQPSKAFKQPPDLIP